MGEPKLPNAFADRSPEETKELLLSMYAAMSPERYAEQMRTDRETAVQYGQEKEREQHVCRLLASGMPVEEIAVVLCLRKEAVQVIEHNHAATTIPEYTKTLKERRKRRAAKV